MSEASSASAQPCWSNIVKQQQRHPPPNHDLPIGASEEGLWLGSYKSTKGITGEALFADASAICQEGNENFDGVGGCGDGGSRLG
ncbi:hypothetical protein LIER_34431 [Lithospermum erythrorhizon]|uniref:Uncharacterized protein n=1 Tax=Lithospermum erythrorhizon TaxID=34254 RepID=A0AAV3RZM8_LITER